MPLESANNISQLDSNYPLPSDPASRGDDHLRLIKGVLKKQFPGKNGNGLEKPITLDEDFLNSLPKKLEDLQKSIDGKWPVGSAVIMFNSQNPNGIYPGTWALVTGDASLSLGDGSNNVGSIYGSNVVGVPLPEHSHGASFSGIPMPEHSHGGVPARTRVQVGGSTNTMYSVYQDGNTYGASAGIPSGNVGVNNAGIPNATIDVRGARIKVNIWKRTA